MKRCLSIRAMLIGLFMVAASGSVALAAIGLTSSQRLIESHRLITGQALTRQEAGLTLREVLGIYSQRHAALVSAESVSALDDVPSRTSLDERFEQAKQELEAFLDRERMSLVARLDDGKAALVEADDALERVRRDYVALTMSIDDRLVAMPSAMRDARDDTDEFAGQAEVAELRRKRDIAARIDDLNDGESILIPGTVIAELLEGHTNLALVASVLDAHDQQRERAESLAALVDDLEASMVGNSDSVEALRRQQRELHKRQQTAFAAAVQATSGIREALSDIQADAVAEADAAAAQAESLANTARILQIAVTLGVIVVLAVFGWRTLVRVLGPLRQMRQQMGTISGSAGTSGDLSKRLHLGRRDEIGRTAEAFNQMMDTFERIVTRIRDGAGTIATSSRQIASGNENLSQRTEEQSSSLAQTASSLEEITATVKQTADYAHQAKEASGDVDRRARSAGEVAEQTNAAMTDIRASSGKITTIVKAIDDIAFQTNLLALNASVEAARAGEQGRGFAVVAGEVRKLAQRSADEAAQIRHLVGDSVNKVGEGAKLVEATSEHLKEIIESLEQVSHFVSEIADATQEQSLGIEEINRAIAQLDQVTQQNASLVQEASTASHTLDEQAAEMHALVSRFQVSDGAMSSPAHQPALPDKRETATTDW